MANLTTTPELYLLDVSSRVELYLGLTGYHAPCGARTGGWAFELMHEGTSESACGMTSRSPTFRRMRRMITARHGAPTDA
ncbi:MAG: hypothetical protein U0694_17455 [Anaerolineae bacterium]